MSFLDTRHTLILLIAAALIGGCSSKKSRSPNDLGQQQVEQLYNKGKRSLDMGNYSFAIDYYRALEANYPYGDYTEQAKLDMLFAFDKLGQVENAVEAADNFIKLYPTHKNVDYAYYMKGVASFEKKKTRLDRFVKGGDTTVRDPQPLRESEAAFEELVKRYPNSIYADDARQRIIFVRNTLADRELAVAKFYYNNETYVAALNRCKTIIYEFETSPAVEGALVLMEKTYLEMGMQDLAASTHEVLVANFPDYQSEKFKPKKKGIFSRLNPFKK